MKTAVETERTTGAGEEITKYDRRDEGRLFQS
jgi:hypothetical protein